MGWLEKHWPALLVTAMVAALVYAFVGVTSGPKTSVHTAFTNHDLAHALGDPGSAFATHWVTCRSQAGRVDGYAYNHRCVRTDLDSLFCAGNTGETKTAIFVRARGRAYHVVHSQIEWVAPPCASTA